MDHNLCDVPNATKSKWVGTIILTYYFTLNHKKKKDTSTGDIFFIYLHHKLKHHVDSGSQVLDKDYSLKV